MKNKIDSYIFIGIILLFGLITTPFLADKAVNIGASPAQSSETAASRVEGLEPLSQEEYLKICALPYVECWEESIEGIISHFAEKYAIDAQILTKLAICESSMNPNAIGDFGKSYGLYQIHLGYHPDITKEQALNPVWATEYTAKRISEGYLYRWSCATKI